MLPAPEIPPGSPIQDVFRILAHDATRNQRIAGAVRDRHGWSMQKTLRGMTMMRVGELE